MISTTRAQDAIYETYTEEELKDIAEYGCASGCASGFIYYHETIPYFDTHKDEIEEWMEDWLGSDYLSRFLISENVHDIDTLKNALVWSFVEMVAQDYFN